jgi:quinol monooxygenase YgiN
VIVVAGTLRLANGAIDKARPHMERMIAASLQEVGCRAYSYAIDVRDPTLVHVFEVWDSQSHLDAHFQTAHINAWRSAWSDIGLSDRNLTRYEVSAASPT